jgi:hypothetical protein
MLEGARFSKFVVTATRYIASTTICRNRRLPAMVLDAILASRNVRSTNLAVS